MSIAEQTKGLSLTLPVPRAGSARFILLLGAICALPVLLYIPFLMEPFMRDEGFYASVAQIVLDGGIPYRDAFDNKPPLIFGWFSLSFLMFGENVWAPRLLAALCLSATTLLVYFQGRMVFSHSGGLIAALAFALSVGIADFQTNANTEYFLVLPMTGALVAFTVGRRTGGLHWFLVSGLLSGLAIMTKQVAAFNFLALAVVIVIAAVRAGGWRSVAARPAAGRMAMLAGGMAIALAAVTVPFVVAGATGDYLEAIVIYAFGYSSGSSPWGRIESLGWFPLYLGVTAAPWVLLAALGSLWAARRGKAIEHWMLVLWLGGSVLGPAVTGRIYDHYFVQMLPGLALLVPAGVYFLKDSWSLRWVRLSASWLLPASAILPLVVAIGIYAQPDPEARHEVKFGSGEGALENTSPELAEYVASLSGEDDYIYNLGFQSEIYFYADRRSPTRFLFDHPFAVSSRYEEEALADLRENPPLIVIDSAAYEDGTVKGPNYYPVKIKEFVDENYEYIGRFYYADLYRLNEREGVDD